LIGCTSSFIQHKENGYNIGWNKKIVERMKSQLYKKPQETLYTFYDAMFSKKEKQKSFNNKFLQIVRNNDKNQSIDSLALGLDYLIQKDLRTNLSDITIPILLIHGEEDNICPLEGAAYIKNKTMHSNLEIIKHAGHIPFCTNPNTCYNIISNFTIKNI
jgi:pimeloyl-[acyl-carrier protein] methyl ester esterase